MAGLTFDLRPGDRLIRSLPGGHVFQSVVLSDRLGRPETLVARGIAVERAGPGRYAMVADPARPGIPVARLVADLAGRPLPRQVLVPAEATETRRRPDRLYPGVTLKRTRQGNVAQIEMRKMGTTPVRTLARLFFTDIETVLSWLTRRPVNAHMLRPLLGQTILSWQGPATARRELQTARPLGSRGRGKPVHVSRGAFRVPGALDRPILLPANPQSVNAVAAYRAWAADEARLQELRAPLQNLERQIGTIEAYNDILQRTIGLRRDLTRTHVQPVALLQSLDLMLSAMVSFKGEGHSAAKERTVERLRADLGKVIDQANDVLIERPVGYEFWTDQIRETADDLLKLVRDPTLAQLVGQVARHYALVAADTRRKIEEALLNAYYLLVASPRSADALNDIDRALDALVATDPPPAAVPAGLNPDFAAAVMQPQQPATLDTALEILAIGAGFGGRGVAKIPGPNSFVVSLLNVAGPGLMARLKSQRTAATLGGRVFRAIRAVARLSDAETNTLLTSVAKGTPKGMAEARDLVTKKWPGRGAGGLLVVLNLAAMLQVWRSNEKLTLQAWADLLGSGTSAVLGSAKILATIGRLNDTRVISSLTRGAGGKALGALGGMLAIVSGVEAARDKFDRGDTVGGWIGVADVAGGTLSVVGFLMAAGAATSWAGVGEVLMLVGAIIGLGAFLWSTIRTWLTEGTQRVAEGFVNGFDAKFGPLWHLRQKLKDGKLPAESQRRLKALVASHKALIRRLSATEFWDIAFAGVDTLADLDFCPALIATLTDASEGKVLARLRSTGRWTPVDQRRCSQQARAAEALPRGRPQVQRASPLPRLRLP